MNIVTSLFPTRDTLKSLLDRFSEARIVVAGDFFLDRYLIIDPALAEPSVETGLVAHQVVEIRNSPGAAGTVVNNLVALGAGNLKAVGVIGEDAYGFELRRELLRRGVDVTHLLSASHRFTPTYTKPMIREHGLEREIERLDVCNRAPTPAELEDRFMLELEKAVQGMDAVILLDQVNAPDRGVLTARVREQIPALASRFPKTLFYADSRRNIADFKGVITKPNHHEAIAATSLGGLDVSAMSPDVARAGAALMKRTGKPVFLTRGAAGMLLLTEEGQQEIPGCRVKGPIDVTGAGDSATAGIVLALCAGATLAQAALIGNLVASITIEQLGTTGTASRAQVLERYEKCIAS